MKIAQIAPIAERVPPKKYGGTERVVSALTEELIKRGHEVTLFASGDSETSGRLESVYPRALREAKLKDIYGVNHLTMLHIGQAYELQDEFDLIHDHLAPMSMPTANLASTPVVVTMHGPFSSENRKLFELLRGPHITTVSQAQLYPLPNINHVGTVHHGLPMDDYPFSDTHEGYALYVGRISIEKGVHYAVDVAQALDMPLILAAKVDPLDRAYFREYIEPRLSERIRWVGEVGEEERNRLMSKARVFLHPVVFREPFGLTLIEAMACGCPIVAFNRGAIPEIVKTGVTGYVVEDVEGMMDAIHNIDAISRAACRAHALENFSVKKMTDGYEAIYRRLVGEDHTQKS
jgi:glycosyltransferase involved in cell wall biosynthesis